MTRRQIALHEASHAVAHVVLGLPLEYASIRRGRTFGGMTVSIPRGLAGAGDFDTFKPVPLQPAALRADVERRVISRLAGELGVLYLAPVDPVATYTDDDSEAIAHEALAALSPRTAELVAKRETSEDGFQHDEAAAEELAAAFAGPESWVSYLGWLRAEARALVVRYGAPILRVADALERHAVLDGEQIAALIYPR